MENEAEQLVVSLTTHMQSALHVPGAPAGLVHGVPGMLGPLGTCRQSKTVFPQFMKIVVKAVELVSTWYWPIPVIRAPLHGVVAMKPPPGDVMVNTVSKAQLASTSRTSVKEGRVPFIGTMVTWLFGMHPAMYPVMDITYGGSGCAMAASHGSRDEASARGRSAFFMGGWLGRRSCFMG
jgi:hypothetical protein